MPEQIRFEFSKKQNDKDPIILLMHSELGLLNLHDKELENFVNEACKASEFTGEKGDFLALRTPLGAFLVGGVGTGLEAGMDAENWGGKLFSKMKVAPFKTAQLEGSSLANPLLQSVLLGAYSASYYFALYFTVEKKPVLDLCLSISSPKPNIIADEWAQNKPLIDGVFTARDLLYEPANMLYPVKFAERCKSLESVGLDIDVLDEAALTKLGMGALLGVGQGSERDSAVVVMRWLGGGDESPIALVGKGVCFDTGGISIKPAKGMEDMKWDMGGAAAVTGAMHALAARKLKRNVVGIIGLAENMPDGNAQRPGDVVTTLSGQTVEVINTDAEGRLVLADILTYVQQNYQPQAIIDIATLTGAIIVSLGKEYAGLFSNNDELSGAVIKAGATVEEKCWRMPMGKAYDDMLKSHIADMKNIGGPYGGSITAACFLERFVEGNTPWVHLDIAGKAWSNNNKPTIPAGGTGFGVRLMNEILDNWTDME